MVSHCHSVQFDLHMCSDVKFMCLINHYARMDVPSLEIEAILLAMIVSIIFLASLAL